MVWEKIYHIPFFLGPLGGLENPVLKVEEHSFDLLSRENPCAAYCFEESYGVFRLCNHN